MSADPREKAIEHFQAAIDALTARGDPAELAHLHARLATAYAHRRGGDPGDNLERALSHYERSVALQPRDASPADWAMTQHNLGTTYVKRLQGDKADNLERAIERFRSALQVRTRRGSPEAWAMTHNNLGSALVERVRGDRARNLERAIRHQRRALTVYTREAFARQWAGTVSDLANAYAYRIRGERSENLEQALDLHRQALEALSAEADADDWARAQSNLAGVYAERIAGDRAANIDAAIECCERALRVFTRARRPLDWARVQMSLGAICRVGRGVRRSEYLARSRRHLESALEVLTHEAFPEMWAGTHLNLANTLIALQGEGSPDNVDFAIAHYLQAQEVYTEKAHPERWAMIENNLAVARGALASDGRDGSADAALHHLRRALEVFGRDRYPEQYRSIQESIGDRLSAVSRWPDAHAAYAAAIEASEDLLAASYTDAGRGAAAARSAQVFTSDALCLVNMGLPREALVQVDRGKTRQLAEALALADLDGAALPPDEHRRLHEARQTVRTLEFAVRATGDSHSAARARAEALRVARLGLRDTLKGIREAHPSFMPAGLSVSDLRQIVPDRGALVAPLITTRGSVALVLTHDRRDEHDTVVPLDDFGSDDLRSLLNGARDILPGWGGWLGTYEQRRADHAGWLGIIEAAGFILWSRMVEPIHRRLVDLGLERFAPVVFLLPGGLSVLPLHAAGPPGAAWAFLDAFAVSYAPSARIYALCRHRVSEEARRRRSLLCVIDPTNDLRYAAVEGQVVARFFRAPDVRTLRGDAADKDSVVKAAAGQAFLHFAGHARYSWDDPMQSALLLANHSLLTLAEAISTLDLHANRLVTLSGCETGITEARHAPDEYLGLPAGFLQAGAPAVLSTLWEVDDMAMWLLTERFYELHLRGCPDTGVPAMPLARALCAAQCWLRDVPAGTLARRFDEERRKPDAQRVLPYDVASDAWRRFAARDACDRPFVHPYYWAAFSLTGA